MVIQAGRHCIILKTDVKETFKNVPVAPKHQWLLGFRWETNFYRETWLSFSLAIAFFIFNLFVEALYCIIAFFLIGVLCHYLNNFVAIFKANALSARLVRKAKAYIWLTNFLGFPQNDFKNCKSKILIVFNIEIDMFLFTAQLPAEKLKKAINATAKVFSQKAVNFINIQSLMEFFSFCLQAVGLARVYKNALGLYQFLPPRWPWDHS